MYSGSYSREFSYKSALLKSANPAGGFPPQSSSASLSLDTGRPRSNTSNVRSPR